MNSTEKNAIAQATMRLIDAWGALQALGVNPGDLIGLSAQDGSQDPANTQLHPLERDERATILRMAGVLMGRDGHMDSTELQANLLLPWRAEEIEAVERVLESGGWMPADEERLKWRRA